MKIQWQVSTDGGKTFVDVKGANKATLILKNVALSLNGNLYRAVFTNDVGQTQPLWHC